MRRTDRRLNRFFTEAAGGGTVISVQDPVRLNEWSEPEPDLALLLPCPDS